MRVLKAELFRSAEALLPPHKCGGFHREVHSTVLHRVFPQPVRPTLESLSKRLERGLEGPHYPNVAFHSVFFLPSPSSRATLSSTPLMKCTDSGVQKRRAISRASLITTDRKSTRLNSSHLGISYA